MHLPFRKKPKLSKEDESKTIIGIVRPEHLSDVFKFELRKLPRLALLAVGVALSVFIAYRIVLFADHKFATFRSSSTYQKIKLNWGGGANHNTPAPSPSGHPAGPPAANAKPPKVVPTFPVNQVRLFSLGEWNGTLHTVIHSDVTQSTMLPDGRILWIFGDITEVNGQSVVSGFGYPHNGFVIQQPNSQSFAAVAGPNGYAWQQVPNWSDGTYFWMGTPVVDGSSLYILGGRIHGASPFSVVGTYVAKFDAKTLAYQGITETSGALAGTYWSSAAKSDTGWWLTGTHGVSCSYAVNCKGGDAAFVPFGKLDSPADWQVSSNIISPDKNIGSDISLLATTGGWEIFTKQGDAYGGSKIERLNAPSMTGPWTVTQTWPVSAPGSDVTYGTAVHPEQLSPPGQVLVSYNVNGNSAEYFARFIYLPK